MDSSVVTPKSELQPPGFRQVLALPSYRYLLLAQFSSNLGDGIYAMALIWMMKTLTGSAVQMSIVLAAELIPTILLGAFAGVFIDRGSKKQFMLMTDLIRGLVVALIVVLWWLNQLLPWMLIAAAVILSSCSAFFTPARAVSVRTLVPDSMLMQAQSIAQSMQTVIGLTAPVLAAIFLSIDIGYAFLFNALSFFVSMLFLSLIRNSELTARQEGKLNAAKVMASLKEGLNVILSVPILRGMILYILLLNFMLAPIGVLFPLFVATPAELAAFEIAFFIGVLAGSLCTASFRKFRHVVPLAAGIVLMLTGFGVLALVHNFYLQLACILVAGIGSPITSVTLQTLFLVKVPRDVLGRASSMMRVMLEGAKPLALLLTGSLVILMDIRDIFLSIAGFGLLLVVLMVLNPAIRQSRNEQSESIKEAG